MSKLFVTTLCGLCLGCGLVAAVPGAHAYFFTEDDEDATEIYQNEDFLVLEEDPGMDQFFAIVRRDGLYKYVKYSAYFNQVFNITNFFELGDNQPQVSAIDAEGRRFFFTTDDGLKSTLYVIGLETGEILRMYTFNYRIAMMEYDPQTERLVGIAQNRHGNNKAITIDSYTGVLNRLTDLSVVHSLKFNTAFFHPKRREVWSLAEKRRAEYLMIVNADTGHTGIARVLNVRPEQSEIYNFNLQPPDQNIFAHATKDSIILAGYNENYLTTFILHLTIHSTNVKDTISDLNAKLRNVSAGGIADCKLTIVNGRAVENFIAYSKAQVLEESLKKVYGVEEIEHKEFFLGQPYSVIATVEGIEVY